MRNLIYSIVFLWTTVVNAGEWVDAVGFQPTLSEQAQWMFAGAVQDENGDLFDYVFQMIRNGSHFHAHVAVLDPQTQQELISEDSEADLATPNDYNWQVGHAFLRFNPINASWIVGLTGKKSLGFNFKIDLLKPAQQVPVAQNLKSGVNFVAIQTGQLNGHLQYTSHQEPFVTARTTWFRQLWLTDPKQTEHHLNGILCQFDDWSGFYAMNLVEKDALRGSLSGAFDSQGKSLAISQFIHVQDTPQHMYKIDITSPAWHFLMTPTLVQSTFVAGLISQKNKLGFCVLSHDIMGMQPAVEIKAS